MERNERWLMFLILCLVLCFGPRIADAISGRQDQTVQLTGIAKDVQWLHEWVASATPKANVR